MQLACLELGAKVVSAAAREFGRADCRVIDPAEPLFQDVPGETIVWMSHGDQIQELGADFVTLAATPSCPIAAAAITGCRSMVSSSTPRCRTRRMER